MEKLNSRFSDILWDNFHITRSSVSELCAQEAKNIAIEFAKYYLENECKKLNNPIQLQLSVIDIGNFSDEYFDNFIEEYYER